MNGMSQDHLPASLESTVTADASSPKHLREPSPSDLLRQGWRVPAKHSGRYMSLSSTTSRRFHSGQKAAFGEAIQRGIATVDHFTKRQKSYASDLETERGKLARSAFVRTHLA
jgi:hypothetical protein